VTVLWLFWQILAQYCKVLMPRPIKRGILGASTLILSKDIDKYAFMCGSNFNETDVNTDFSWNEWFDNFFFAFLWFILL
jgi:hypothetical protein